MKIIAPFTISVYRYCTDTSNWQANGEEACVASVDNFFLTFLHVIIPPFISGGEEEEGWGRHLSVFLWSSCSEKSY